MVVMFTTLVLLAFTPVLMKDIKNEYTKTTSANFTLLETEDLKGTLKKDHSYDFKEPGVLENSIHLLLKNCSNNTTNYNCKLLFMNCSKHCIMCVSQGVCKGCEVGFYGQTCHLKCLLNCGADGCNQHTGKCDGSGGKDDIDVDIKIYVGAGVGAAAASVIGLFILFKKCKDGHDYQPLGMVNVCCNSETSGKCCC